MLTVPFAQDLIAVAVAYLLMAGLAYVILSALPHKKS
jgi:hypothetical protein